MKIEYYKEFSNYMGKEMEYKVYGEKGVPCLVLPSMSGRFYDYEDHGMIESAQRYIEEGKIQFFCCDSNYEESWLDEEGDPRERIEKHEQWFQYIMEELIPRIKEIHPTDDKMMVTGCGIGGFLAFTFFLRRPDVFQKVLSVSAVFHAGYYLGAYHDELTYQNSPIDFLPNLTEEDKNMKLYRSSDIILCCGQGYWEMDRVNDHKLIEDILIKKEIDTWVSFWGYDVTHDWYWWRKELEYFLQFLL